MNSTVGLALLPAPSFDAEPDEVGRSIVIVDDDRDFCSVASRLFTARGFTVVAVAADRVGALDAVRRHRPDCVLLDVHLADQRGLDVARELAGRADAPTVVLTSVDDLDVSEQRMAEAGVQAFVDKALLADVDLTRLFRCRRGS